MRTIIILGRISAAAGLLLAAALPVYVEAAGEAERYAVRVDPGLSSLAVRADFAGPVTRLGARSRDAARFLVGAAGCAGEPLRRSRGSLEAAVAVRCIEYRVDLRRVAAEDRRNHMLAGGNVVAPPADWLWLPVPGGAPVVVDFDLPDGHRVSVPWMPRADGSYEVQPSPRNAEAAAVFGRFASATLSLPGSELRIAVLEPDGPIDSRGLIDWIGETAARVVLAYGHFPHPSPQVLVVPVGGGRSGSPVPYGRVLRDGGEAIELFVNESRSLDELRDDWTATHEFSHLLLPYVRRSQRWVSEGFAQYYQNVLMARAGSYTEERAWQKLYEGFERGRRSRPELSPNAAAAGRAPGATMKVYWAGAALALMADIELREQSGGRKSLDTALAALSGCCLPAAGTWDGAGLYGKLDELAGSSVLMPLYRRHADRPGFPDTGEAFRRLGIKVENGRVVLEHTGRAAVLRAAIMAAPDTGAARVAAE